MKRTALAPLAAVAAALTLLALGAAPAAAANHYIHMSAPNPLTVGQPTVIQIDGVVAPPAEFWDASWIEVVALPGNLMPECPGDADSAGLIAEEAGNILAIAMRPNSDEAGNFANAVAVTPSAAGSVMICGYLYNEVGYTWAAAIMRLDVVAPSGGGGGPGGSASGGRPVNLTRPWVTRSGRRLVCHPGKWSNTSGRFAYSWLLDGSPRKVKGQRPLAPGPSARGHRVSCRVTAYGPGGTAAATSRQLRLR